MTRVVDVLNEGAVKVARMRAQRALRFFKILFSILYSFKFPVPLVSIIQLSYCTVLRSPAGWSRPLEVSRREVAEVEGRVR